jgi:hypothetical protein
VPRPVQLNSRLIDGIGRYLGLRTRLPPDGAFAPHTIRCWKERQGIAWPYIAPRKPVENAFMEGLSQCVVPCPALPALNRWRFIIAAAVECDTGGRRSGFARLFRERRVECFPSTWRGSRIFFAIDFCVTHRRREVESNPRSPGGAQAPRQPRPNLLDASGALSFGGDCDLEFGPSGALPCTRRVPRRAFAASRHPSERGEPPSIRRGRGFCGQ